MSETLAGKRVVILGLARQGTALAKWLCEVGARVTISDLRHHDQLVDSLDELDDLDITYVLGEHPEWMLDRADLLCLSGGVPVDTPIPSDGRIQRWQQYLNRLSDLYPAMAEWREILFWHDPP